MSHFLDRLTFFNGASRHLRRRPRHHHRRGPRAGRTPTASAGSTTRSCARRTASTAPGSCSWKIYVKGGIVTWETQQTDYPRTRPDLPNHEPRGCARGASYSWYLYCANRVKYPLVRARLLKTVARGARDR